jgi:quercetin dioxygenase-like cupin family protein
VTKTARGWEFWFVPTNLSPTFNFKMSYVGPRSANHPPHAHPEEEIYYIFEGKAEFSLDGKTKVVGPDSTMFCPSGVPHGIRNVGDTPLRYAVIKANYPAEK